MQLPCHGRRTVIAALLLATIPLGCTSSRLARAVHRPTVESTAEIEEVPTSEQIAGQRRTRADVDVKNDGSREITLVAANDESNNQSSIEVTPESPSGLPGIQQGQPDPNSIPLDLASVLSFAGGQNPQVGLARERIAEAYAQVDRADVLWLPSVRVGMNYNAHNGAIQDVAGNVFNTNRSAAYGGLGAGTYGAGSPTVPGP